MAKKVSSKKSFRSLFSRSEANLSVPVDKQDEDKQDGEKKKFKFFKFKTKPKHDKSSNGSEQVVRSLEPSYAAIDGDVGVDVAPDIKRASLYATAPRSKDKEITISDLDSHKTKKFSTLSLAFKKKKKKEEGNLSKSTFVLNGPGPEDQFETLQDLSQMKLDPTSTRQFSMSQPELDTNTKFDIPSPPPVNTNHSESYFALTNQSDTDVPVLTQPEFEESLTNGFDIHKEPLEAPIATITELHDPDLSVKENVVSDVLSNGKNKSVVPTVSIVVTSEDDVKSESNPAPIVPEPSSLKPAAVDLVSTSLTDEGLFQKPIIKDDGSSSALFNHQPVASDMADGKMSSNEISTIVDDKKATITEVLSSAPTLQNDKSSFSGDATTDHQEVSTTNSVSDTLRITTSSAISGEKNTPVIQDGVYGALYDSLFPQNFTSEVVSSMLNPSSKYHSLSKHSNTQTEQITVQSTYDCNTETNTWRSSASSTSYLDPIGGRRDDAVDGGFSSLVEKTEETATEKKPTETKKEPVLVKILNESHTETNYIQSRVPLSCESDAVKKSTELMSPETNTELRSSDFDKKSFMVKTIVHSYMSSKPEPDPAVPNVTDESASFSAKSSEADAVESHSPIRREPVLIKILNERHTETNFIHSSKPTESNIRPREIQDLDKSDSSLQQINDSVDGFSSVNEQTAVSTQRIDADFHNKYPSSSLDSSFEPVSSNSIPHSELSQSLTEEKTDSRGFVHNSFRSVTVSQNDTPPFSTSETSQETNTQVTESKHRVILIKQLVTAETSDGPAAAASDSPTEAKGIVIKVRTESISDRSGSMDVHEGLVSPTYLSVGSDDGSTTEVYYSAEEDNMVESGNEEMLMVAKDQAYVMNVENDARLDHVFTPPPEAREKETRDQVIIVKIERNEGETETEVYSNQMEVQQKQFGGQMFEAETGGSALCSEATSLENEQAHVTPPQTQAEVEKVRKEEFLATPVQPVNTLMVCDFAPPSNELHGEEWSEGNESASSEIKYNVHEVEDLLSQGGKCVSDRGEYIHTIYRYTTEEDVVRPTLNETKEQLSEHVEGDQSEVSKERITINSSSSSTSPTLTHDSGATEVVRGNLTHSTEPQSDATEAEHNRTPPSIEWVDPITQSSDKNCKVHEQVPVLPSGSNADECHPVSEAVPETPVCPAENQENLNEGFLTVLRNSSVVSEVSETESQQTQVVEDSEAKMNPGYSSLSTRFTSRNSTDPKESDSKLRFYKLSLISENDTDATNPALEMDYNKVKEQNGTDVTSEYTYTRYQPHTMEGSFSDSLSDSTVESSYSNYSSSSTPSSLPEAPAYKHLSNAFPATPDEHDNRLSDSTVVDLRRDGDPAEQPKDEWRRSLLKHQWEELAAPAGERKGRDEREAELRWDSKPLPVSDSLSTQTYDNNWESLQQDNDEAFTGVFKATYVELIPDPAAYPCTPPASPEEESPGQCDMANLMDTLKNMEPSFRPRGMSLRPPAPSLMSSLPPIVEDASSPSHGIDFMDSSSPLSKSQSMGPSAESLNGLYTLPANLGLRKSVRDVLTPLELMKTAQDFQSSLPNGNAASLTSNQSSRLDKSFLFGNLRASSTDPTMESGNSHRPLLRTSSLPDAGLLNSRMSVGPQELSEMGGSVDLSGARSERLSFYMKPPISSATGEDLNRRMSLPSSLGSPPASNSPTTILSPSGSIDFQRPFTNTDSALSMLSQTSGMGVGPGTLGAPLQQRSLSLDGPMGVQSSVHPNMHGGIQFESQESDQNLVLKYRAFPDAYLTKAKEHGKLNPRPGKMYVFDRPGMCGQRIEIRSDVIDATSWELQETISIRVVRGGWVLYEKPNFKGEKIALDEGDIEITNPFSPPEEPLHNGQNGQPGSEEQNGEKSESDQQEETKPAQKFVIGSIRRAVRDYSVPEISLFPEENAEGKKVIFRDTSEDARIFGFPVKANSIIISAGLWLVYAHPFFQGVPRVLEVGGYTNPAAWGVEQPYVGSLHPLKVGEPRVENLSEPKMVIYDKPYFSGKSRTITSNMRDFMTRIEPGQTAFMYNTGSLKVLGGIWVGYEKEGFRGHQYLLEEGEYHDWRVWGGCNAELRSVRVIRADLTDPVMMMLEQPDEEQDDMPQDNTFEVTEAIPDVELFGYKTSTRSIEVLSGAWVAYSHVDYSGNQYILEKGFYSNCVDWGSQDSRICSVQPILLAPNDTAKGGDEIILYSEPDFLGDCHVFDQNQEALPEKLLTKSCRVVSGSWVLYEEKQHSGNMFVLSEGDYPNLTSMGCPPGGTIRSARVVPMMFSVPSISLFGLECLEGREITTSTEIVSMVEEGFNNHIMSLRVNRGCWVLCEHSNYRGRQFLLEPIEITNWHKFSSLSSIGSMYPVRQKRHFFRIKNNDTGNYLSVQGDVEEMKSGRVVASAQVEPMSDIWYYQEGLLKNKLSSTMALQAMGNIEPGVKVVLWAETRLPIQTWEAQMSGLITSLTFPGVVLDVKGGKSYDKDHVVIMPENEERPSQQWELELI
ncbi:uncharacterized protein crybg2 isoform X2 [Gouania willdenowi]|uniref:uncharacterized protein crybg2 isoform X2 n=1 Tax=Gouania willdenowi TaxID=441366 RepID=UPI0010562E56|nr:uncharacterized protein LOC114472006 isoform X2 [Gouania willdenowi]